ncbi:BcepGomrgp68 [Burkholderia phage BcepGomr]|nr:BcepGomrgp68 [Burkholderia phage BcepGomr]ABP63639.1 BcepGomrgp68 [Burkholderia phage BcepGomr]
MSARLWGWLRGLLGAKRAPEHDVARACYDAQQAIKELLGE